MADRKKLENLLSGDAEKRPIRRGRGYQLSTSAQAVEPLDKEPTTSEPTTLSRNVELQKSRNPESEKQESRRKKLGYEIRADLIRSCKQIALDEERKIYEVIEEAIEEYLTRRGSGTHPTSSS